MKASDIWPGLRPSLGMNLKSIVSSLLLGLAVSTLTVLVQFVLGLGAFLSQAVWFRILGLPVAWIGIWRSSQTAPSLGLRFFLDPSSFLENLLFWAAICFVLIVVLKVLGGELPVPLLPMYVLALGSARIELEFEMAVAAFGSILRFGQIDPFSYAHIVAYFAMALLLFSAVVTRVSRLPFREIFRLSCLGLPIILMPPILDNYVLHRPLVYNFYTPGFFAHPVNALGYLTVVSGGIKLEALLVAGATFSYLLYRTRSIIRSFAAVVAVVAAFVVVTTPIITDQFNLMFSQAQFFAIFLILTYFLIMVDLGLAQPKMGSTIIRRMRLRGIHFPAMVAFGAFLVHPGILSAGVAEDYGLVLAGSFIAFLTWQAATVFDDIYDRGETQGSSLYLGYGLLTTLMAVLAAIPFGSLPLLLTAIAAYLAMDYPRLRRRHYLFSGVVIGIASSISFLLGTSIPITSPAASQPIGAIALALFAVFSGGSLVKDIAGIDEDKRFGIDTVLTKFEMRKTVPVVATFVATGCILPALFLRALPDMTLFLSVACANWLLIVLMKGRSYRPVLVLYFIEGVWVFYRMFVPH
jgi:4-hydroxybenzoate polyprenyltransferase